MRNEFHQQELTAEQKAAIAQSIKLGRILQEEIPQIADDYKTCMFLPEIVDKYNIVQKYGVNETVARVAISYAIRGHKGTFEIDSYDGLFTNSNELEKMVSEHRHKLGKLQGPNWGHKATIKRGDVPYRGRIITDKCCYFSEMEFAFNLSLLPEYQRGGIISTKLIAERLNELYHDGKPVRDHDSVSWALRKIKKIRGIQRKPRWGERQFFDSYCVLSELEFAYMLSQNPKYRDNRGRLKAKLIAEKLNELYHNGKRIRNSQTVTTALYRSEFEGAIGPAPIPFVPRKITDACCLFSEKEIALNLSRLPEYRKGRIIKTSLIAAKLNEAFHNGMPVRNYRSVSILLSRIKKGDADKEVDLRRI